MNFLECLGLAFVQIRKVFDLTGSTDDFHRSRQQIGHSVTG